MESFKKILKYLLQPWSTIYKPKITSFTKAVIVGCSVSLTVWAGGWTLFSSSPDLGHRSAAAVMFSPDVRTIEAVPDSWKKVGTCSEYSFEKPTDNAVSALVLPTPYCRGWALDEKSFNVSGFAKHWTAVKYELVRGWPAYSTGRSRTDALEHTKDLWINMGSSILMPMVVLLVVQMGVLVGYQYFRQSAKLATGDEEIT